MPINVNAGAATVAVVAAAYTAGDGQTLIVTGPVQKTVAAADLPTADPHKAGQLWSNAGVVTISAG